MCASTGALGDREPCGNRSVRQAFSHQRKHLALPVGEGLQRVVRAPAPQQPTDDGGVDYCLAVNEAPQRVDDRSRTTGDSDRRSDIARLSPRSTTKSVTTAS